MIAKIARGAGLLSAGVLAVGLAATQASAQPLPPYYPGVAVYPGYVPGLPPREVVAIVRSTGLEPLSGPMRHGLTYSVLAADQAGREYRVIVDARIGRVLRAVPLPGPYYAGPVVPPYGVPMGPMGADGYGPSSRIAAVPPAAGGAPVNAPGVAGVPGGAGAAAAPKVHAGPPLPRPRPKLAATDSSAPTGAPPQAAQTPAAPEGVTKETKDTTGAIPTPAPAQAPAAPAPAAPPAPPAVTPPAPPPVPDEMHE